MCSMLFCGCISWLTFFTFTLDTVRACAQREGYRRPEDDRDAGPHAVPWNASVSELVAICGAHGSGEDGRGNSDEVYDEVEF